MSTMNCHVVLGIREDADGARDIRPSTPFDELFDERFELFAGGLIRQL
ncbi:MAG: hypothetical protein ACRD26_11110 [Vicinamibacterales bacterium]